MLEGRYHRELTEEEIRRKGITPEPVTESGDWTVEALKPDIEKQMADMVDEIRTKVKERDDATAHGEDVGDTRRPGWRVMRVRDPAAVRHAGRSGEAPRTAIARRSCSTTASSQGSRIADPAARAHVRPRGRADGVDHRAAARRRRSPTTSGTGTSSRTH